MPKIIAYTYEADYHCIECTKKRSGVNPDADNYKPSDSDENFVVFDSVDRENNPIHAVFGTDETEPSTCCGTCGHPITEPFYEQVITAMEKAQVGRGPLPPVVQKLNAAARPAKGDIHSDWISHADVIGKAVIPRITRRGISRGEAIEDAAGFIGIEPRKMKVAIDLYERHTIAHTEALYRIDTICQQSESDPELMAQMLTSIATIAKGALGK